MEAASGAEDHRVSMALSRSTSVSLALQKAYAPFWEHCCLADTVLKRLNAISFSSSDTIPDEMRDVQLDDTVREHSNDNHDGQKSSDGRSSGMVATQAAMVSVQDLLSAFSVKAGQMMRSDDCEGMLALLEALERAAEDVVISRSPQRID